MAKKYTQPKFMVFATNMNDHTHPVFSGGGSTVRVAARNAVETALTKMAGKKNFTLNFDVVRNR